MAGFLRLDPITRKRFARFRRIKRGYYSLIILLVLIFISFLSNYIANSRALIVKYEGKLYFPTYVYHPMTTFGQIDEWGFEDAETDYRRLKEEFEGTPNWVLLPPIPFSPLENDFSYYKTPEGAAVPPPHPPDWSRRHFL